MNWWRKKSLFFLSFSLFFQFFYIYIYNIYDAIPVQWFWENYSLLLEIYNKHAKKNPRQKADSSTNTKRKKRKEKKKKNVIAQHRSSHFYLIFPFSYSSHCTARVYMYVCAFGRCLNKEDPVERSRYECSTKQYWSKREKNEMNTNEYVDEWHMCLYIHIKKTDGFKN